MSIACSVACLDCLDEAPGIGDGGFVGGPSLELGTYDFKDWSDPIPTFWTLYEPMIGLGLRTSELEEFHSWLTAHRGHRVHLYSDHDSEFPPELDEIGATREAKMEAVMKIKARRAEIAVLEVEGVLVRGHYRLECTACSTSIESPSAELLARVSSHPVVPAATQMFRDRWRPLLKPPPFGAWRVLSPATDPEGSFVPQLVAFLDQHGEHPMVASTRPAGVV